MRVFRRKGDGFVQRAISIHERLKLMGFPPTYLDPAKDAFEAILTEGHYSTVRPVWTEKRIEGGSGAKKTIFPKKHWLKELDPKYHKFNGAFHGVSNPFKFDVISGETEAEYPLIEMSMLPPFVKDKKRARWYTAEQYAKRLIGNAMSVPVLEHLLKPLTKLYAHKEYPEYKYHYAWQV